MTLLELERAASTVRVDADGIRFDGFVEGDPQVVAFVAGSDDPEHAAHRCLEMGARVLGLAGSSLDTQLVEHRFGDMAASFERSVEQLAQRVDETSRDLLDEESGDLTTALGQWLGEVQTLLGDTFDESSKRSVIAKLEGVLEKAREEQVSSIRRLLDPDTDGSPLARWRTDIVREVRERGNAVEEVLNDLTTRLGLDDQRAELMARTAVKGFDYEITVFDAVQSIVTPLQDVPVLVGNDLGSVGGKVGDIVVDVDTTHVRGRRPRYVIECKDRALSLKKALDELDVAIANRDADAGIIVFSGEDTSPSKEVFEWFDRRAVVVLDRDDPNPHALRLACLWARWMACRDASEGDESVDLAKVTSLIDDARRSLKTASAIKGSNTRAKKAVDEAGRHLDALISELSGALDELALCVADGADQPT